MTHELAVRLEMLLKSLVEEAGKTVQRGQTYRGVVIDADAFNKDDEAIKGLWLAVDLLQGKN